MRTLFLTLITCLFVLPAQAKYSGGTGEPNDSYQIATAADLIALGETPEDYDKHFILTADIDLEPNLAGRKVFNKAVIAPDTDPTKDYYQGTPFSGVFDGNDHTISNLRIAGKDYVGLFGQLLQRAEVRDLGMVDISITASGNWVGGLVGMSWTSRVGPGDLIRCYSTGVVSGGSSVGGLMGSNGGTAVTQCYTTAAVSGSDYVGGLVGDNTCTVVQCYSAGAVTGKGSYVGGLVGGAGRSVRMSVWDVETSGLSGSAGGVGLTTAEMMDPDMLALNGFANDPNWVLDAGHDYPRLAWEGRPGQVIPEPRIDWLDGGGTVENPYRIDTADQLILLGKASILWGKHFLLGADIDLDPRLPEGQVLGQAVIPVLTGIFDGNRHTISHLTTQGPSDLGLFGQLESGAEVKNLGIVDVNIAGSGYVTGGLVGINYYGTVTNCYSTGAVSGSSDSRSVGGLVGINYYGTVTNCYSTGSVSSTGQGQEIGGLVGSNHGTVTNCYSTGSVSGTSQDIGGLVGLNSHGGVVTQCYSTAVVNSTGQYSTVGGLVGQNSDGTVANCYSTGSVSGTGRHVGGLLGFNGGNVTYCYSTGAVIGTGDYVGGLVGLNGWSSEVARAIVDDCFWDIQASGQELSDGGTGKTTAEMQTAKTFLDAGWDFVGETANGTEDIWWINEGKDYPRLWWESHDN